MENLYLRESPLTPISHKMQNFVLSESFVVNFVLKKMNSFENIEKRHLFNTMIQELEKILHYGMDDSSGTKLWIQEYNAVLHFLH